MPSKNSRFRLTLCTLCSLGVFALPAVGQDSRPELDYGAMASKIVTALKLRSGERVLMRTDPNYFAEIVQPLANAIRTAGAVPLDPLPVSATLTEQMVDRVDVLVMLPVGETARQPTAGESALLRRWVDKGGPRRELHFHWSDGSRSEDGLPAKHPPEFDKLYEDALDIDYRALDAAQERAIQVLRLGTVRIHTPAGTDLMFRIGTRPFNKQNGDGSAERARSGRVRVDRHIELPAGVLRVAPVEESVAGSIVIPEARFGNVLARRVVLQLDNGRITRVRAAEGQEAVEAALAKAGDAALQFREFALGFNPKLIARKGQPIPYYGYGAGVVRFALGDNEELGGNVRGDYVRWFFFPDASLHVDFRYLVRDGALQ